MMVDRAFWVPDFRFSDEQRETLLAALADSGGPAEQFVVLVESRTRIFLAERKNLRRTPEQRPKTLRESLAELDHIAEQLDTKIGKLDPLGDEADLSGALVLMQQPADFLQDLQRRLRILRIAAGAAISRSPKPTGGRPAKDHDIGFIAEVALDYERVHGALPPTGRGSWFCGFVDYLFSALPGASQDDEPDHYRLVAQALKRIRHLRKHP